MPRAGRAALIVLLAVALTFGPAAAQPPPPTSECNAAVVDLARALLAETSTTAPSDRVVAAVGAAYEACGPGWIALAHPEAAADGCTTGTHRVGNHPVTVTVSALGVGRQYTGNPSTSIQVQLPGGSYTRAYDAPPGNDRVGMWSHNGGQGTVYIGAVALGGAGGVPSVTCLSGFPCAATAWATYKGYFSATAEGTYRGGC